MSVKQNALATFVAARELVGLKNIDAEGAADGSAEDAASEAPKARPSETPKTQVVGDEAPEARPRVARGERAARNPWIV